MTTTKFNGQPVNVSGCLLAAGAVAPEFRLVKGDLTDFTLADCKGKRVVMNIFPSLDTGVCAASVRKFNQLAASMPDTLVLCISRDLPFAQSRFCVAEGIDNVVVLSDFRRDSSFGEDYGVQMVDGPLAGLLARAVVVINPQGKVSYSRMSPEITEEPDYSDALSSECDNHAHKNNSPALCSCSTKV